jgi:hypothetical protein
MHHPDALSQGDARCRPARYGRPIGCFGHLEVVHAPTSIFFDVDGVLIDSLPQHLQSCRDNPSQSLIPAQPASAYVRSAWAGISSGFLPDLQYARHCVSDFRQRPCTYARASLKGASFEPIAVSGPTHFRVYCLRSSWYVGGLLA